VKKVEPIAATRQSAAAPSKKANFLDDDEDEDDDFTFKRPQTVVAKPSQQPA
jgi:hypothetical protein